MNEQTYLNTVCKSRRCGSPCKPKPKKEKDCCYTEYTCCTPRGKLTFRSDRHSMGISIDVNHCGCNDDKR